MKPIEIGSVKSMRYYPINLNIKNRNCLVVGGGGVGTRKVMMLLKCGADVTVISPEFSEKLLSLAEKGAITLKKRSYHPSDLEDMLIVFGASSNADLNRQIATDARRLNLLCNIADSPENCDFIVPSTLTRGDLTLAISTSGKSPALARKLRRQLEKEIGEEYAPFLDLMGAVRRKLLEQNHDPAAHKAIFDKLINGNLLEMIKTQNMAAVHSILRDALGDICRCEELTDRKNIEQSDG